MRMRIRYEDEIGEILYFMRYFNTFIQLGHFRIFQICSLLVERKSTLLVAFSAVMT